VYGSLSFGGVLTLAAVERYRKTFVACYVHTAKMRRLSDITANLRQLKTRLALTPCNRATPPPTPLPLTSLRLSEASPPTLDTVA
jgi:hypothetical protein